MVESNFIEDIVKRLSRSMSSSDQSTASDTEKNFRSVLQAALAKLDLVTRDEFDIQTRLLERTREKLERLESEMTELEGKN
ncbi:MAG: accessory factor UbiK family protein [Gammaproteobacteria bacterium]